MLKSAKNLQGSVCLFEEKRHLYTVKNKPLTSVTSLIHRHFPAFDTEKIASRYAKKHGLDKEKVIKKWDDMKVTASEFGTKVHDYAEERLLGIASKVLNKKEKRDRKYARQVDLAIKAIRKNYVILETEKMLFSTDLMIAGTVDILAKCKTTGDLVILDWKTNKEIKKTNRFQTGLPPLAHLDHCNWNHYCLQLNLYKQLLHFYHTGRIRLGIIHILEDGVTYYKIPDMSDEIKAILI